MRVAVFSDVHGNLSGLEAVLDHIETQPKLDLVVFAGDACLFGPRPLECVNELRHRNINCLVGNTDAWILQPPPLDEGLDDSIRQKRVEIGEFCNWTLENIDQESVAWLRELDASFELRVSPSGFQGDDLLIVHANPRDLLQVIFPDEARQKSLFGQIRQSDDELDPLLKGVRASMIAFGHLHIPGLRNWGDISLANISSVSFPGDGDPRAKYAIASWHESSQWEVEYYQVNYPIQDEISAFEERKPPGWERSIEELRAYGLIAQVV
jgi:predicted phosphodiesterase